MAQVKAITSEAIEAAYRALTPSQSGFTEDLQASNVILPIVDLTSSAEGSAIGENLQTAWDFSTGMTTVTSAATSTLVTTAGFWKIDLNFNGFSSNSAGSAQIFIDDGATTKDVWRQTYTGAGSAVSEFHTQEVFVVYLRSGDSLKASLTYLQQRLDVWYRQIADVNGVLVNPLGFTPQ